MTLGTQAMNQLIALIQTSTSSSLGLKEQAMEFGTRAMDCGAQAIEHGSQTTTNIGSRAVDCESQTMDQMGRWWINNNQKEVKKDGIKDEKSGDLTVDAGASVGSKKSLRSIKSIKSALSKRSFGTKKDTAGEQPTTVSTESPSSISFPDDFLSPAISAIRTASTASASVQSAIVDVAKEGGELTRTLSTDTPVTAASIGSTRSNRSRLSLKSLRSNKSSSTTQQEKTNGGEEKQALPAGDASVKSNRSSGLGSIKSVISNKMKRSTNTSKTEQTEATDDVAPVEFPEKAVAMAGCASCMESKSFDPTDLKTQISSYLDEVNVSFDDISAEVSKRVDNISTGVSKGLDHISAEMSTSYDQIDNAVSSTMKHMDNAFPDCSPLIGCAGDVKAANKVVSQKENSVEAEDVSVQSAIEVVSHKGKIAIGCYQPDQPVKSKSSEKPTRLIKSKKSSLKKSEPLDTTLAATCTDENISCVTETTLDSKNSKSTQSELSADPMEPSAMTESLSLDAILSAVGMGERTTTLCSKVSNASEQSWFESTGLEKKVRSYLGYSQSLDSITGEFNLAKDDRNDIGAERENPAADDEGREVATCDDHTPHVRQKNRWEIVTKEDIRAARKWKAVLDTTSNRYYYYHRDTKEVTWAVS